MDNTVYTSQVFVITEQTEFVVFLATVAFTEHFRAMVSGY